MGKDTRNMQTHVLEPGLTRQPATERGTCSKQPQHVPSLHQLKDCKSRGPD